MVMRDYDYQKKLQRVPHGLIFGVAEGIARYLTLPVWFVRSIWIAAAIFTGFFPVATLYLLLAIILPSGPA